MDRNQENQIENAKAAVVRLKYRVDTFNPNTSEESLDSLEEKLEKAEDYLQKLLSKLK